MRKSFQKRSALSGKIRGRELGCEMVGGEKVRIQEKDLSASFEGPGTGVLKKIGKAGCDAPARRQLHKKVHFWKTITPLQNMRKGKNIG